MTTLAYVHSPRPPYPRIAGPIYVPNVSRSYGLSESGTASFEVSRNDVALDHVRVGSCWVLEQPDIGEDPWAGFIKQERIPYQATSYPISLVGPKEALLDMPLPASLPAPANPASAFRSILASAQARDSINVFPGNVEGIPYSALVDARADTTSSYIDTLAQMCSCYWGERLRVLRNELFFYIDFGHLENVTTITLNNDDVVVGLFTRSQAVASITVLSSGTSFMRREEASVIAAMSPAPSGETFPASQLANDVLASRNIGPASRRHVVDIQERLDRGIVAYTLAKHEEYLREVDELTLALDATRETVRKLRLGDVVRLDVKAWQPGLDVMASIHVRHIEPQAAEAQLDIAATVMM